MSSFNIETPGDYNVDNNAALAHAAGLHEGNMWNLNHDGFAIQSAWLSGDDGFLARDLNGNAKKAASRPWPNWMKTANWKPAWRPFSK
jgi:hypothetical protein